MNVEFLLLCYFVSLSVDWILQHQWQANNKSNWTIDDLFTPYIALVSHSFIYAAVTSTVVLFVMGLDYHMFSTLWDTLFISHIIIDSRIPVKAIMRFKGITKKQMDDPRMDFMHIGIDHRLHELVILVLSYTLM